MIRNAATDRAPWLTGVAPRRRAPASRTSVFVNMRDGVRLAVDVHLPKAHQGPLPTIVRQTRYYRGIAFRSPFQHLPIEWLIDHAAATRDRFLANGFAWVDVCARGSGASFGHRPCPWSPNETADGREIVDWIIAQSWSNGLVGTTGVSYDGTTAEMLLVNGHPAVRACAPRFSLYDTFADVAFPGGIHLAWFTELWSLFNRALDAGEIDAAFGNMIGVQLEALADLRGDGVAGGVLSRMARAHPLWRALMRTIARGVRPVDEALLTRAIADHGQNFDVHLGALRIHHRDDVGVSDELPDANIDVFSPHAYRRELEASGVPILSFSGWLDGAYCHSAIKRFRTIASPKSQLVIGPWDHGGMHNISPNSSAHAAGFDQDGALVRFFAHHLRGDDNGVGHEPAVRYFTIGSERWCATERWPPPDAAPHRWHFSDGRELTAEATRGTGHDTYRVDEALGTGRRSRWASLLGLIVPVGYSRRAEAGRRMLVYRSSPLSDALTVAGHPIATLYLSADQSDAHVFVYLEDEHPDGHVEYVTEGQLRALHRKVAEGVAPYDSVAPYRTFSRADARPLTPGEVVELKLDLLPIAWRFERGHRLRIAIAGADCHHFARLPTTPTLVVHRSEQWPSHVELPITPR